MRDARVCVRSSKQKGKAIEIPEPISFVTTDVSIRTHDPGVYIFFQH